MEHRELGRTGEKVAVIGMGTWRIGSTDTREEWEDQVRSLRKGIELGMTLIDTAEVYSSGRSEQLVGEVIKGERDGAFIATKVSPEHLHYDDVLRACEGSVERLGVKYIDLYQIHWPNPSVPIKETMRAMERLVSKGKIRFIGVSNFSSGQTMEAQESLSRNELVSNQVEYSLTSRHVEHSVLPYCEKEKITIMAYSPLAKGSIPKARIPKDLLAKYGMTPAQVVLNWVTFKDCVVAIPKAARIEHLEENARSVETRLSTEDYNLLSRKFS